MARREPPTEIPARELFDRHPLPMWVYDLETLAFLAVNDAAIRHYGYSRQEFLGLTIKDIRPPAEVAALLEKLSRPIEGYDAAGTWRHRTKDGTLIDVEITSHTVRFSGRPAKLILAHDVTERERLQRMLTHASDEWRQTFDALSDVVALLGPDGAIRRCNQAMTRIAGKGYPEILGRFCGDVVHALPGGGTGGPVQQMLETRSRVTATVTVGSRIFKAVADPFLDDGGRCSGALLIMTDITEREQAEQILLALTLQQQAILNNIPDIAWLKDDQGRFVAANEPFCRAAGLVPADLIGKTDLDIWPRELAERYRADDREVIRTGSRKVIEEPLAVKEGKMAWIETIKTSIVDATGRVVGTTGIARDITARKQAETAIREQKDFTEQLIQGSSVATFVINHRHEVVLWNKACEELTGVAGAAILGRAEAWRAFYREARPVLADLVLDRDAGAPSALYPNISRSVLVPEGLHAERWIDNLNGKRRFIVFDAAPIHDGAGTMVAAIETIQDLTASKRAEERIAESEERYRNLFDNASDMVQSVAPDGRFLYVNAAWRATLGYGEDDLRALTIFDVIHPSCAVSCGQHFSRIMSGESIDFLEAKFVAKDGRVIDVEGSANARRVDGACVSTQGIFRDVTERRKLQEEIYRISRDWEETFDTLTDMVTVHDQDFTIIRANKAAEKILGLPLLRTQPLKCFEYFHGACKPPAGCPSCASLVTGKPSVSEVYEPHLGRQLEIRAIPRVDSAGRIAGLIHVVRDITERTRAEEARKEQVRLAEFGMRVGTALNKEGTLQQILGCCTDLLVSDLDAALARIWTVTPDKKTLVLQASSGITAPRDGVHGPVVMDQPHTIATIARTRTAQRSNAVIGDPQVDQEWAVREGMVSFAGYPLQVGPHLVGVMGLFSKRELSDFSLNALEAVAHNIASGIERILSETAVKRYGEDLAALNTASNDLLALASLPQIYDGICRCATEVFDLPLVWLGLVEAEGGDVTIASAAGPGRAYLQSVAVRLGDPRTGGGPTGLAIQSKRPFLARRDSPEYAPWRAAAEESGFETSLAVPLLPPNEAGTCIGALNFYSRVPDSFTPDRIRLCQIFANQAAIAIENGRLIEGLEDKIAVRTREYESANAELQRLNQELELRRLEAESANRSKSDFLANMSHELRTPLNAIIGFSDIMVRGMAGPLAEKPTEYLGDILAGGKHLLSLINDVLDLSKVEAGKMEVEPSEYDAAELVNRSLVLFREKALHHQIDLRAEIAAPIDPVFGDERKMRQVLYNLVSNAVKFTPDGGAVLIRVRAPRDEGRACLEIAVSDTGIGISPEDQQRLFLPFSQLSHHLTKEREGTGLGLSLCKSFVEMHGGSIGVESAAGRGSTFTVRVPLCYGKGRRCSS